MSTEVLTVLVADDEPRIVDTIARWLRAAGHVALTARSGREAMTLLPAMRVDALVTDLVMPDGNGMELIMDVRERHPDMRIVAISSAEQSDAAFAAGASHCLRKPLSSAQLLAAITP